MSTSDNPEAMVITSTTILTSPGTIWYIEVIIVVVVVVVIFVFNDFLFLVPRRTGVQVPRGGRTTDATRQWSESVSFDVSYRIPQLEISFDVPNSFRLVKLYPMVLKSFLLDSQLVLWRQSRHFRWGQPGYFFTFAPLGKTRQN